MCHQRSENPDNLSEKNPSVGLETDVQNVYLGSGRIGIAEMLDFLV
jgi:hypothetical protein